MPLTLPSLCLRFSALLLILHLIFSAHAQAETLAAPQRGIQASSEKLRLKLQDPAFIHDFSAFNAFVQQNIYPIVDFDLMSSLVLGQHWKAASVDERTRFTQEFQRLLVRTYSRAFVEFKNWSVHYLPLDMEAGASKVMVKTEVLQPGMKPIDMSYRMVLVDGTWKAYDILIAGVSLVTNYRATFNDEVVRSGALNSVINNLAKRNAVALVSKKQPVARE